MTDPDIPMCQACRVHREHRRCTGENTLGTAKCQCQCRTSYSGLAPGDRIALVAMDDPYAPIPVGATGTITKVTTVLAKPGGQAARQLAARRGDPDRADHVSVAWDAPNDARSLALVIPPDRVRVLP